MVGVAVSCCSSASLAHRSELVALQVEDVANVSSGPRLCLRRGKTNQTGQGAERGLPRGRSTETCPVRTFEASQVVVKRQAGPLFRKISTSGRQTARGHRGRGHGGAAAGPRCPSALIHAQMILRTTWRRFEVKDRTSLGQRPCSAASIHSLLSSTSGLSIS